MQTRQQPTLCPCGGGPAAASTQYADCCGRFHARVAWPPTAEELMRSRYSAFVLELEDWIFITWHPRTRPEDVSPGDGGSWRGLTIVETSDGGVDDQEGVVEFVARHVHGDMHERSRFARRAGRWLYLDGVVSEA